MGKIKVAPKLTEEENQLAILGHLDFLQDALVRNQYDVAVFYHEQLFRVLDSVEPPERFRLHTMAKQYISAIPNWQIRVEMHEVTNIWPNMNDINYALYLIAEFLLSLEANCEGNSSSRLTP